MLDKLTLHRVTELPLNAHAKRDGRGAGREGCREKMDSEFLDKYWDNRYRCFNGHNLYMVTWLWKPIVVQKNVLNSTHNLFFFVLFFWLFFFWLFFFFFGCFTELVGVFFSSQANLLRTQLSLFCKLSAPSHWFQQRLLQGRYPVNFSSYPIATVIITCEYNRRSKASSGQSEWWEASVFASYYHLH